MRNEVILRHYVWGRFVIQEQIAAFLVLSVSLFICCVWHLGLRWAPFSHAAVNKMPIVVLFAALCM